MLFMGIIVMADWVFVKGVFGDFEVFI